jgi:hypothetical protein
MRFKVEAYKLSEFLSSKEFDDISIQHNLDKLLKREHDVCLRQNLSNLDTRENK